MPTTGGPLPPDKVEETAKGIWASAPLWAKAVGILLVIDIVLTILN